MAKLQQQRVRGGLPCQPREFGTTRASPATNLEWEAADSIRAALERVDSGQYGVCVTCGGPISKLHLIAIPWGHLCASCQATREVADDSFRKIPESPPVRNRRIQSRVGQR